MKQETKSIPQLELELSLSDIQRKAKVVIREKSEHLEQIKDGSPINVVTLERTKIHELKSFSVDTGLLSREEVDDL